MKPIVKKVALEQLNGRMIINAYTGFDDKFNRINKELCLWLRHNFKGTEAIIYRNGQEKRILADNLMINDNLKRLCKFPKSRQKLVIVTPNLIKELKKRGFINFVVVLRQKSLTKEQEEHKKATDSVNYFVDKIKDSISTRENATDAIENMMDSGRKGKIVSDEVAKAVEEISKTSSVEAMSALVSLKESDQTYAHCVDVGVIFEMSYFAIKQLRNEKGIFKDKKESMFAAFLHDFGKSKIPKDILDSQKKFDRDGPEMKLMLSHPAKGAELLKEMGMPSYTINMAYYHHVKLNTFMKSSYPQGASYETSIMESRLLAIVDIYQALVGKRNYKKSWSPPSAIRYLDALAGVEFDPEIWNGFLQVTGKYPKSSLVELSDNSLGFVMSVPKDDLDRPQVVVVRNAAGEDLKRTPLIDLATERDISIVKDIDAQDVFGERCLDAFLNINVV